MNGKSDIARKCAAAPLTPQVSAAVARGMRNRRPRKVLDNKPRGYWAEVMRTIMQLSRMHPTWPVNGLQRQAMNLVDEAVSEGRLPILEGPKQQILDLVLVP